MGKRPIKGRKRLNLSLPVILYKEVAQEADKRSMSVTALLCQSLKLMLFISQLEETPGSTLLIKEGEQIRELKIIV